MYPFINILQLSFRLTLITIAIVFSRSVHSQSIYRDDDFANEGFYENEHGFTNLHSLYNTGGVHNKTLPSGHTLFTTIVIGNKTKIFTAKVLPNGQRDFSYGDNGSAIAAFDASFNTISSANTFREILVQPNGKIMVVVTFGWITGIFRINADGSADYGFGENGSIMIGSECATCVGMITNSAFLNNQGNIYIAGYNISAGTPGQPITSGFLVRLNNNGTTDLTLAGAAQYFTYIYAICEMNNKIYIAGSKTVVNNQVTTWEGHIRSFNILGQPDMTFGGEGTGLLKIGGNNPFQFWQNRYPVKLFTNGSNLYFLSTSQYHGAAIPNVSGWPGFLNTNLNLSLSVMDASGDIEDIGGVENPGYRAIIAQTSDANEPQFIYRINKFEDFSVTENGSFIYNMRAANGGFSKLKIISYSPPYSDFVLVDVPQQMKFQLIESIKKNNDSYLISGYIAEDLNDVNCNNSYYGLMQMNTEGILDLNFGEGGKIAHPNLFNLSGRPVKHFNSVLTSNGEKIIYSGESGHRKRDLTLLDSNGSVLSSVFVQDDTCYSANYQGNFQFKKIYLSTEDYIFSTDSTDKLTIYNHDFSPVSTFNNSFIYEQLTSPANSFSFVVKEYNEEYFIFIPANNSFGTNLSIFKLNSDLTFDYSFGTNGVGHTSLLGADYQGMYGHFINSNGIFLVGTKYSQNLSKIFLMKFDINGNQALEFGDYGNLIVESVNYISFSQVLNVEDNWIYVKAFYDTNNDFFPNELRIFRMDFNGQKDMNFGPLGYQTYGEGQWGASKIESMIYADEFIYFVDMSTTYDHALLTPCIDCFSRIRRMTLDGIIDENFLIEELDYGSSTSIAQFDYNEDFSVQNLYAPNYKKFETIQFNYDQTKIYATGGLDHGIFRFCLTPCNETNSIEDSSTNSTEINPYPNPTSGIIKISGITSTIKLNVFDSVGKVVFTGKNSLEGVFDLSELSNGIYLGQFHVDGEIICKRIVLNK